MSATHPRHATIVLAAGASRRLGAPKQLLQIDGESLLRRAALAALQTQPMQSIVVLGAQSDAIFKSITDLPVQRVDCADWDLGMGASLRSGIAALDDSIDGALIVLCDQPDLTASHLQRMTDAWRTDPTSAIASAYGGTVGVPALLPRAWFSDLLALRGDHGARELLRSRSNEVTAITAPNLERDIDFPEISEQALHPCTSILIDSDDPSSGMSDVTALIQAVSSGDSAAMQTLFGRVYIELKQLAHDQLAASSGHTLNTTGLVHEAFLKLARPEGCDLQGRAHFFALAAKAMRQIVIDKARAQTTDKRGGGHLQNVTLGAAADVADSELGPDELLRLDVALSRLANDEPRLAELVEQRFFAGLSIGDIALMQGVSERTLNRDWRRAKAYLHAALYADY